MRVAAFIVLSLPTVLRADEATSVSTSDVGGEEPALLRRTDEPLLHLQPLAQPLRIGLPESYDVDEQRTVVLGKRTWVELQGVRYTNTSVTPERAWTASLRLAHDLGPFTIVAYAAAGGVDSRYTRGSYYDVGLSIGKSKKLSRWMTAWIALSIAHREWLGEPPPGEVKGETAVTLSIGTTFK